MDVRTVAIMELLGHAEHVGLMCFDARGQLRWRSGPLSQLLDIQAEESLPWQALSNLRLPEWADACRQAPWTHHPNPLITMHARWLPESQELLVLVERTGLGALAQHMASSPLAMVAQSDGQDDHPGQTLALNDAARALHDAQPPLQWSARDEHHELEPALAPWLSAPGAPGAPGAAVTRTLLTQRAGQERRALKITSWAAPKARLFLAQDVTEQHQREQLKEDLLSIASHELRNPLTPLKGLLQLAMQQHEEDREVDYSLLQKAEAQVSRLVRLANTLLDVSRMESGRMTLQLEPLDISSVLDDLLGVWVARYGQERFQISLPQTPCVLMLDISAFEQVLSNLLDNAIKHSPSHEPIFVTARAQERQVEIIIEDRGVGIERARLPMLFKRFYQAEPQQRARAGLGLGLYICQKIIQEHQGQISIESDRGGPTIVRLRLPAAR